MLQPDPNRTLAPRIIGLQKRMTPIGKIRIGVKGSRGEPVKLDAFRFTSPDEEIIRALHAKYGGKVQKWKPSATREEWELISKAKSIPFLISPLPVSQAMEDWHGGECRRRCDSVFDKISDGPCRCAKDGKMVCKPVTRFNVILMDCPDVGVWTFESRGWTAATELTQTADMLLDWVRNNRRPLNCHLILEHRRRRKDGVTNVFPVVRIKVPYTPTQILSMMQKQEPALEQGDTIDPNAPAALQNERVKSLDQNAPDPSEPMIEQLRKRYFALHNELGWPPHDDARGTAKQINYRVWSEILGRLVGPANGAGKFSEEDFRKLIEVASGALDDRIPEPGEFEQYRLENHVTQLDL